MDLWIKSQDRTKLVKADNISYMDTAEDYERKVHSLWNDCKGILGIYKTKERALEVLDEIDKYKNKLEKAHFLGMEESEFVSSTFQMPKE